MSASLQKSWPSTRDCKALTWAPGGGRQKGERKRQGEDKQELRPLKKRFKPSPLDDKEGPKPPGHLFDLRATDISQPSFSLETPKVPLVDLTADDDILPGMSHDITLLSPDTDEIYSLDSFNQQEKISPTSLTGELELGPDKVQMLADDALFSEFLRSPSLSLCHFGADHGKDDLPTIAPADICLSPEGDPYLAGLATERIPDVKRKTIQTKRPCLTLYIRPPKTASKPKVSLRLNPPKRAPKPKSIRRGPKNRSSKRV